MMQITSRFTIAVHALACVAYFRDVNVTSQFIAASAGANPVAVRMVMQGLKAAGLIRVSRGKIGIELGRPLEDISFYDVYKAVGCLDESGLFHFHEAPCMACPVGRNIHAAMDGKLNEVQNAMEDALRKICVSDVVEGIIDAERQRGEQTE